VASVISEPKIMLDTQTAPKDDLGKLVTVIISTHNYGHLICEAIESVLEQTYANIELIVVDDGSTDNTPEIVKLYPTARYLYQDYIGKETCARAYNTGIKFSHGEYITCLDANDKLLPTYIEECVQEIEKDAKSGFVWTGTVEFGASNHVGMPRTPHHRFSFLRYPHGQLGAMLVRKKAYDEIGLYDENLDCLEDWDMAIRLSLKGWKGKSVRKNLHLYRVHERNLGNIEKRKNYGHQLERKYQLMKQYKIASRLFDITVFAFSSPRIFLYKMWNKGLTRLFHIQKIQEPPTNLQHTWVNEKSVLKKVDGFIILDCGCGIGRWGHLLRKNHELIGLDVMKDYLHRAKKGSCYAALIQCDLAHLPFKESIYFDTALAVEVIEHLSKSDGVSFLLQLGHIAKKIVLTTPKSFEHVYFGEGHPETHVSFWTRDEIMEVLA
jgi:glycosyltransferase involved in cell wall biosynthesis